MNEHEGGIQVGTWVAVSARGCGWLQVRYYVLFGYTMNKTKAKCASWPTKHVFDA